MRIVGEEWAGSVTSLGPLLAGSHPCPVCGHPTGDCTTDFHQEMSKMADETKGAKTAPENTGAAKVGREQQAEVQAHKSSDITAPEGRVIKAGEPVTLETGDVDSDQLVVVKENVYQEFFPENSKRPSHRLLFHKGQQVLKSQLERVDTANQRATNPNA